MTIEQDRQVASWPLGAMYVGEGRCRFCVWAPFAERVEVRLVAPNERVVLLQPAGGGYYCAEVDQVEPGSRYLFRLHKPGANGDMTVTERPDPASRSQPEGVHGPSEVIDPAFAWNDAGWAGLSLAQYVIYELHVGTFTPEGTFEAIIERLDDLVALGVTALEIMPVAQFPGSRNWGYDGVYPFAVQDSYGGVAGFKRLIDACHQRGLAVVLDVVYNHFGPEGNYLRDFGPYFTDRYKTPWGAALNFDGPASDEVRRFFLENVRMWAAEFHIDAFRLDAVHAIFDFSARTFLAELADLTRALAARLNRQIYTIAESDLNDTRLIRPPALGGFGLDAQWSDEFHHGLHTLLTGERDGYYEDFGDLDQLVRMLRQGYAYTGNYSPHRGRRHGSDPYDRPAEQFVVCTQNHDQVGNRMLGERLTQLVSFEQLQLAAGLLLLSPYVPMLFMGEEYAEPAPFQYFVSHGDPDLVEAVRQGRRAEFAAFAWQGEPPDPQSEETFLRSKLDHDLRTQGHHRAMADLYTELIRLRKTLPALAQLDKRRQEVLPFPQQRALVLRRWIDPAIVQPDPAGPAPVGQHVFAAFNCNDAPVALSLLLPAGAWRKLLDPTDVRWRPAQAPATVTSPERLESAGVVQLDLAPWSFVLFGHE